MITSRGRGGLSSHILSTTFSAIATIAMLAFDNAYVTITLHPSRRHNHLYLAVLLKQL